MAFTVYAFNAIYPDMVVFLKGSTKQQTKVYKYAIIKNWDEISKDFLINGVHLREDGTYDNVHFDAKMDYHGFFIFPNNI